MIKDLLNDAEDRMGKVEKILISDFASLRAGSCYSCFAG